MKQLVKLSLVAAAIAVSGSAFAATPGVYAGAGIGYGYVEQANVPKSTDVVKYSQTKGSVAGRVFVGYTANKNLGVEAGYSYLGKSTVNVNASVPVVNTTNPALPLTSFDKVSGKVTTQLQAGDVVGKLYLPVGQSPVNLYALGGGAIVHSSVDTSGATVIKNDQTTTSLRPKFGLGVSYDIPNSPVTAALEGTRIQGNGSHSSIPNVDTYMLAVSYNFGS